MLVTLGLLVVFFILCCFLKWSSLVQERDELYRKLHSPENPFSVEMQVLKEDCSRRVKEAKAESEKKMKVCRLKERHLSQVQISFRDMLLGIAERNEERGAGVTAETVARDAALIDKYFIQITDKIRNLEAREKLLREEESRYRDVKGLIEKAKEVIRANPRVLELERYEKIHAERESELKEIELELEEREDELQELKVDILAKEKAIEQKRNCYAPLATALSCYETLKIGALEDYYKNKPNPALVKAFKLSDVKVELRNEKRKYHEAKFLLDSYEALFPWLVEYKEFDLEETVEVPGSGVDPVSHWVPAHEYGKLLPAERNQKALERYLQGKKSNREIGKLYERFIGYEYEQRGYNVSYFGALKGFEDLGRDIIAIKGNQHLIIQCKYWGREKMVHENSICQLYGSTVRYRIEHSDQDLFGDMYDVHAILVTSTTCSEMARDFAKYLHVELFEGKKFEEYPMVKCNIGKNGERIYHLPFDQMYDRVVIELNKGECYAKTCFEAEEKGFRRAFRWKGSEE